MTALDMFPETRVGPELDLDERYTLRETMNLILRICGVERFDIDIAACAESHWAPIYYSKADDALVQPWFPIGATRAFCNPPYSEIRPWVERAWSYEFSMPGEGLIAMLLPSNRTEQPFWQDLVEHRRDGRDRTGRFTTHFLPGRVRYGHPGNPRGIGVSSPPFGSVLLVWRQE